MAADPFGHLDFGTAPVDPPAMRPIPPLPLANPLRARATRSGARRVDPLALLDTMIFDDDPVGAPRSRRSIIGSGGSSPDELSRQDDLVADEDEVLDSRPAFAPISRAQSQRRRPSPPATRRRQRAAQPGSRRATTGVSAFEPFDNLLFGGATGGSQATPTIGEPFMSFPLRDPSSAEGQTEPSFGVADFQLRPQPFRQPAAPLRPVSPEGVAAANAQTDRDMLFGLPAVARASSQAGAGLAAGDVRQPLRSPPAPQRGLLLGDAPAANALNNRDMLLAQRAVPGTQALALGENKLATGDVLRPQQPFRQPPIPQRRVSPDDVAADNAQADPRTLLDNETRKRLKAHKDVEAKYGHILKAGNIDLRKNALEARNMSLQEFLKHVSSGGDWDYKINQGVLSAKVSDKERDDFGNFHFGMVARMFGFNLITSLYGAGSYQTYRQEGGNLVGQLGASPWWAFSLGGILMPDELTRRLTKSGFTWGDNEGDSLRIMEGWDFADQVFSHLPPERPVP